jgi:hypothetical protein
MTPALNGPSEDARNAPGRATDQPIFRHPDRGRQRGDQGHRGEQPSTGGDENCAKVGVAKIADQLKEG